MAKEVKRRRGNNTETNQFTGVRGEVSINTDKKVITVHDGETAGGHHILSENYSNAISPIAGYKNKIINGNFDIWQRGISRNRNSAGENTATYLADKWAHSSTTEELGGTPAQVNISRGAFTIGQTEVLGNPRYFWRITNSTQGTDLGAPSYDCVQQGIEDARTLAGKDYTCSFYARSSIAGKVLGYRTSQFFGIVEDENDETLVDTGAVTLTNDWQKFTFSGTFPSVTGATIDQDISAITVAFFFQKSTGLGWEDDTAFAWGGTGTVDIAQVQLEEGSVTTPFEFRPIGVEQELCERYYEQSYANGTVPGTATTTGRWHERVHGAVTGEWTLLRPISFKTSKRANPTIKVYNPFSGTVGEIRISTTPAGPDSNAVATAVDIGEHSFSISSTMSATQDQDLGIQWAATADLFDTLA